MICSVATRSSAVVRDELVHPTSRRMYERILVVISHKYIDPSLKREYELSDRKTCECIAWPVHGICMDMDMDMDVDMDMDMDMGHGHGHGPWHVASRCVGPDLGRSTEAVAAISLKVN